MRSSCKRNTVRIHRSKLKIIEKSRQISELKESDDQRMDQFLSYSSIFGYEFEYFAAVHNERKNKKRGGGRKERREKIQRRLNISCLLDPFVFFSRRFAPETFIPRASTARAWRIATLFRFHKQVGDDCSSSGRSAYSPQMRLLPFYGDRASPSSLFLFYPTTNHHRSATISFRNYFLSKL